MTPLHELARAAGLQVDWEDALGKPQRVSDDDLIGVLNALGLRAETERDIHDSQRRLEARALDACRLVSADVGQPFTLPSPCRAEGLAELVFEDGTRRDVAIEQVGDTFRVPAIDVPGYHKLVLRDRQITLAVAPNRCFRVQDAVHKNRIWGPAVQIPSLRDDRTQAFGDFGTLAQAARAFAARGADAIAISPVHALFPADPHRYSPYAPSSRLFLNALYADPALIGVPLAPVDGPDLIDWEHAIPQRIASLFSIFQSVGDDVRERVKSYRRQCGPDLDAHATFDALYAHFYASGARGWQDWPDAFHDPASQAVAEFARVHDEQVRFYIFLQWLAEEGLAAAQATATDAGMAIGLIADLAVGMDPGGSHAWSRRKDLLTGLSIGAPPDLLGPDGQNWGITGFSPHGLKSTGFDGFIVTLRAALRHAGGIRIDHALGLRRLWVVPDGASASQGAYLTYPMEDMLRLLALESHRNKAIVIGEDLGTVPEGLRPAMDERAMLGMRVLWFERDEDGAFLTPDKWPEDAAAMTGTHDLPTVAGWWQGRDIDWTWQLERTSRAANEAEDRANREGERKTLWRSFRDAGIADGEAPDMQDTDPVVDAAIAYVGSTKSSLAILPIEDIAGLVEQPNLPGTVNEHPNWRRRMRETTQIMLDAPAVAVRLNRLNKARRS